MYNIGRANNCKIASFIAICSDQLTSYSYQNMQIIDILLLLTIVINNTQKA